MRIRSILLFAPFTLAAAGCALVLGFEDTTLRADGADGGDEGSTIEGGEGDAAAAGLTATPSPVVILRGTSVPITVTVNEGNGGFGVTLTDLPAGLTAPPATIAPGAKSTTITLTADKTTAVLGSSTAHVAIDPAALPPIDLTITVSDPPGTPDVTFNGTGLVAEGSRGTGSTIYAIAIQPDGKIMAGGTALSGPAGWYLRRFTKAGPADATFVPGGSLPVDGELRAVAVDALQRIVCVGSSLGGAQQQLTVVRLGPTGLPDGTFNGTGIVRLAVADAPLGSNGFALALHPTDGSMIVAGSRNVAVGPADGIAIRLKGDGTRDATFGGGIVSIAKAKWIGASVDPTGIVTLGGTDSSGAGNATSFVLARRAVGGGADGTFGTGGALLWGGTNRGDGFAKMPDGTLALVGESVTPGNLYFAGIATTAGKAVFARGVAAGPGGVFFGAAAQADGRLVAAGHTVGAGGEARVERLLPDGGADDSFGDAGVSILEPKGGSPAFDVTLYAAAVQPDGRILVGGNRSNTGAILYRLWP